MLTSQIRPIKCIKTNRVKKESLLTRDDLGSEKVTLVTNSYKVTKWGHSIRSTSTGVSGSQRRQCSQILNLTQFFLKIKIKKLNRNCTAISEIKTEITSSSDNGTPTAAPAGLTCLKEAAAGRPRDALSSLTSCHPLRASQRLMNPGDPLTTVQQHDFFLKIFLIVWNWVKCLPLSGSSAKVVQSWAGFWCGFIP